MTVLFCDLDKGFKNFEGCDLVVFGFCDNTPQFLTKDYSFWVEKLKKISKKDRTQFVFLFYVVKKYRKFVGGVLIKEGKIANLFGECFSKKRHSFKVGNKTVSVLFYYDIYSKSGREVSKFSSVVIGVDDDDILENTAFLNNKFFDKLILVCKNLKISCGKFKKNAIPLKMCANIMYKI